MKNSYSLLFGGLFSYNFLRETKEESNLGGAILWKS